MTSTFLTRNTNDKNIFFTRTYPSCIDIWALNRYTDKTHCTCRPHAKHLKHSQVLHAAVVEQCILMCILGCKSRLLRSSVSSCGYLYAPPSCATGVWMRSLLAAYVYLYCYTHIYTYTLIFHLILEFIHTYIINKLTIIVNATV